MGYSTIVLSALTLILPPDGGRSVTTVDPKGACREEVRFAVPVSDIQQVWMPSCLNLSFATFAFPDGLTVGPASAGGDGFDSIENNKPEGEHP